VEIAPKFQLVLFLINELYIYYKVKLNNNLWSSCISRINQWGRGIKNYFHFVIKKRGLVITPYKNGLRTNWISFFDNKMNYFLSFFLRFSWKAVRIPNTGQSHVLWLAHVFLGFVWFDACKGREKKEERLRDISIKYIFWFKRV